MTDKKDEKEKQIGEKTLKLNDLKDFTVGEIVEKSNRVSKENFENETVLDKYIRQHRGEIETAKSKNLDSFIHSERAKLVPDEAVNPQVESSLVAAVENYSAPEKQASDEAVKSETSEADLSEKENEANVQQDKAEDAAQTERDVPEKTEFDQIDLADESVKTEEKVAEVQPQGEEQPTKENSSEHTAESEFDQVNLADEHVNDEPVKTENESSEFAEISNVPPIVQEENQPVDEKKDDENEEAISPRKSRKVPIIIGVCALALIAAGATYWASQNNQKPKTITTTQSSSDTKSSAAADKFKADYAKFFVDKAQTQLKNSEFAQLSTLVKDYNAITDKTALSTAKSDYNNLKTQIDAINTVNGLFTSAVITDGKLNQAAKIKANLNSIPTAPKTNNDTLNQLITQAIDLAQTQKAAAEKTSTSSSMVSSSSSKNTAGTSTQTTSSKDTTSTTSSATTTTGNTSTTTNSTPTYTNIGLSSAGVALDNSDARVQPQSALNTSDPAFTWAPGIKALVLDKCRARGYITGDNFILVPVAIHTTNGAVGRAGVRSGYYNLYRPDGSYLLTINDQTGYFFGNASQHPLDF